MKGNQILCAAYTITEKSGTKSETPSRSGELGRGESNHSTPPPVLSPAESVMSSKFSGGRRVAINLAANPSKSRTVEGGITRHDAEFVSVSDELSGASASREATRCQRVCSPYVILLSVSNGVEITTNLVRDKKCSADKKYYFHFLAHGGEILAVA